MNEIIIGAIISLWLGSIEYRMRQTKDRADKSPTRSEVTELINLKQEALKTLQAELKEDIKDIKHKLDRLLEK